MLKEPTTTDVFLLPGEYFVGGEHHRIRTLLGSCVSITLWHPGLKVGAMSHYLLANHDNKGAQTVMLNSRYGDDALSLMVADLHNLGVKAEDCQGKIFGGGQMFPNVERESRWQVGQRNGITARQILQARGIEIVSESLFGEGHRQIVFNVSTGDVWSRQVKPGDIQLPGFKEHA
jgi:chemotaxis protein CheD